MVARFCNALKIRRTNFFEEKIKIFADVDILAVSTSAKFFAKLFAEKLL